MNKAKKLYGIMTLALALSLANTVPVKAVAVDEAFAGVVSASKNTTSTAFADAETCTACGKENGYRISRTYNPWQTTGETRNCEHNLVYGLDYWQERNIAGNYKCGACGNTFSIDRGEYRWVCKGIS